MLAELVGWYAGQDQNRRRFPRVRRDYDAKYSINSGLTWQPIRGVDLGGGGMCAYSDRQIGSGIIDVVLMIDGQEVPLKAQSVWNSDATDRGKPVHCHGLQFTSIDAHSWKAVMHWVTGKSYIEYGQTPALRIADTDVAHFLPGDLRKRMLAELMARGRYDALEAEPPHFDYGGVRTMNGHAMHRFTVHTKVHKDSSEMRYATSILCDDSGKEIVVQN